MVISEFIWTLTCTNRTARCPGVKIFSTVVFETMSIYIFKSCTFVFYSYILQFIICSLLYFQEQKLNEFCAYFCNLVVFYSSDSNYQQAGSIIAAGKYGSKHKHSSSRLGSAINATKISIIVAVVTRITGGLYTNEQKQQVIVVVITNHNNLKIIKW